MAGPSIGTIAGGILTLVQGLRDPANPTAAFYQSCTLDEPPSFDGATPNAVVWPTEIVPKRLAAGSGRMHDRTVWEVLSYIDRQSQTFDVAVLQLYTVIDLMRLTFSTKVQLGLPSSTILCSGLDGQISRPFFRVVNSVQYRCYSCLIEVYEEWTAPITA